jgi:hypothetical protein
LVVSSGKENVMANRTFARTILVAFLSLAPLAVGCTAQMGAPDEGKTEQAAMSTAAQTTDLEGHLGDRTQIARDTKFVQWTLTPSGKIAGMLLEDGTIVRTHPEAIKDASVLSKGDAVHVEGFEMKDGDVLMAANVKKGDTVIVAHDSGKFGKHAHAKGDHAKGDKVHQKPSPEEMQKKLEQWKKDHPGEQPHFGKGPKDWMGMNDASLQTVSGNGTIVAVIPGFKGHTAGVILSDGTTAYVPFHANMDGIDLKKGDTVSVTGKGGDYPAGRALVIKSITLPGGAVKELAPAANAEPQK